LCLGYGILSKGAGNKGCRPGCIPMSAFCENNFQRFRGLPQVVWWVFQVPHNRFASNTNRYLVVRFHPFFLPSTHVTRYLIGRLVSNLRLSSKSSQFSSVPVHGHIPQDVRRHLGLSRVRDGTTSPLTASFDRVPQSRSLLRLIRIMYQVHRSARFLRLASLSPSLTRVFSRSYALSAGLP
jgi:hypothetical protein